MGQQRPQKAEISDASGAPGVSGHTPKRVWLRVAGGGVTFPSGKSYTTFVGDDREMPKHIEYVRADLATDLVKALERLLACCENHPAFTNPSNQITVGRVEAARAALASAREVQS